MIPLKKIHSRIVNSVDDRPFLLGINGVDGSGKTEFSKKLKEYLEKFGHIVHLIHFDDFHFEKSKRYTGRKTEGELFYYESFNFDRLKQEILKPLTENGTLKKSLKLLDLNSDEYSLEKNFNISSKDIVIVEGVFLFRLDLTEYFNLKVFLSVSEEEVIKRALERDKHLSQAEIPQRYRNKYLAGQKIYFEINTPLAVSDIIIDNNNFLSPEIIKNNE